MAKWFIARRGGDFAAIGAACGISPVLARLIRNRGAVGEEETRRYLEGGTEALIDPLRLPDIPSAVRLLREKISAGEPVRIIGDYDVDGICSSYILLRGLREQGARADAVLPDRIRDGYGLNTEMIERAAGEGIRMIITCDNGIAAAEAVHRAKELGMTVIVTDHHEIPFVTDADRQREYCLPEADVIVEPKLKKPGTEENLYPFPELCGAAVAWKLICALRGESAGQAGAQGLMRELLAFCAIATVCDVMPLRGENRILVREGLRAAEETENPGLRALLRANELEESTLRPFHAGFILGPCLNASGRLDSAQRALNLFDSKESGVDPVTAAAELRRLNEERRAMQEKSMESAEEYIKRKRLLRDFVLVLVLPDCHQSLAGIVAGKLRERYERPVFVLTDSAEEGMLKGSGRSIEAYDMYAGMQACRELLIQFGGHRKAGGLTLRAENAEALRLRLNECCGLSEDDLCTELHLDLELPPGQVTPALAEELGRLEPCGNENSPALFVCRNIRIIGAALLGHSERAVRFLARDEGGEAREFIFFGNAGMLAARFDGACGQGAWERLLSFSSPSAFASRGQGDGAVCAANLAYEPRINEWRGRRSVQLVVKDFQFLDRKQADRV
ncbi:single-stranded-DNA-specific exonuclease RecJ [Lachnoclostridium sp. Marseille-P6806]|uniref:single-stranded-DNA-specific exonuclease RecJ n=1 Tax=Lachnoclostridium sp. Marseille-P6806 TaxID=2364793 RepID=UPI00103118C4|nr:single-stranded-DNA-specific exonuclease RecJ [Lachnoclostridium sp. Marseille-P6806]